VKAVELLSAKEMKQKQGAALSIFVEKKQRLLKYLGFKL
jgi:hypothetical protein